jgi:hypothetical protein
MIFLVTILAAISTVAFTFDIASARMRDNPNSGYDASGQAHSGRVNNPVPSNNPPVKKTTGKKNKWKSRTLACLPINTAKLLSKDEARTQAWYCQSSIGEKSWNSF